MKRVSNAAVLQAAIRSKVHNVVVVGRSHGKLYVAAPGLSGPLTEDDLLRAELMLSAALERTWATQRKHGFKCADERFGAKSRKATKAKRTAPRHRY